METKDKEQEIVINGMYESTPRGTFKVLSYYVKNVLVAVIHALFITTETNDSFIIDVYNMKILNPKFRKKGIMTTMIKQIQRDKRTVSIRTSYTDSSFAAKQLLTKLGFVNNSGILEWKKDNIVK